MKENNNSDDTKALQDGWAWTLEMHRSYSEWFADKQRSYTSFLGNYATLAWLAVKYQPFNLEQCFAYAARREFPAVKKVLLNVLEHSSLHIDDRKRLGSMVVEVLEHFSSEISTVVEVLLSSKDDTTPAQLYEAIKPQIDELVRKKIVNYGISLKSMGIDTLWEAPWMESHMKKHVIPLLFVVRDIPKFCMYMKEYDYIGTITHLRATLLSRLETDSHSEVRKYLVVDSDDLYLINAHDPILVSRIKKVLNALTYVRKVVEFINSMELTAESSFKFGPVLDGKGDKKTQFLTKVIWHLAMKKSKIGNLLHFDLNEQDATSNDKQEIYLNAKEQEFINNLEQAQRYTREAQTSLIEVLIPIGFISSDELKKLWGIVNSLPQWMTDSSKGLFTLNPEQIATHGAEYLGRPAGVLVAQLDPNKPIDFSFLTQHLGLLPGYLDDLTQIIASFGPDPRGVKSLITEAERDYFKNLAVTLFFKLNSWSEHWSGHDRFPVAKYALLGFRIKKETIIFFNDIGMRASTGQEVTAETVEHLLFRLKQELFANLICYVESRELYLGLAPGVLIKPLINELDKLYKIAAFYATFLIKEENSPGVNAVNSSHLNELNSTPVLTRRLQNMVQQKNECQYQLEYATKAKEDLMLFERDFHTLFERDFYADTLRDKLMTRYKSFEKYVIEYNPECSVLISQYLSDTNNNVTFFDIEAMSKEVGRLCDRDCATFESYLTMVDSRLVEVPKQMNYSLCAQSSKYTHSWLMINELSWFDEQYPFAPSNKGAHDEPQSFFNDLTSMSIEHLAALYNYHATRILTLRQVEKELDVFLTKLEDYFNATHPKELITDLEARYRVVQPYLVDWMSAYLKKETDEHCVAFLHELALNRDTSYLELSPPIQKRFEAVKVLLNDDMNQLKQHLSSEMKQSENRCTLLEVPHNELRVAQTVEPLTLESELVQRQNKWIRHQELSRTAHQFKIKLKEILDLFHPSLGLSAIELDSDNMPPCPEMEHDLESLTVPSQVSWIKRMLNVIYYIERNVQYLESLDRNISKTDVTSYFLQGPLTGGIYQIALFVKLSKAQQNLSKLMQEPQGRVFMDTLKGVFGELMGAWNQIHPLYFPDSNKVTQGDLNVDSSKLTYSALWYSVLGMKVLPEHLNKLFSNQSYTVAEAHDTQIQAKEMARYIEDLISHFNESQYFYLYRHSPYILFDFIPELLDTLKTFCKETNHQTKEHLARIQSTLHQALKATDELELTIGLRAGLLSVPTKVILDKFFNAFIQPLGISLQESMALMTETKSFNQRLNVNDERRAITSAILVTEKKDFKLLNEFLVLLKRIKAKQEANKTVTDAQRGKFEQLYLKLYPLLQSQQVHYVTKAEPNEVLDQWCHELMNKTLSAELLSHDQEALKVRHYRPLKNVLYVTEHVHAAKRGHINTAEMREEYLIAHAQALISMNSDFVRNEVPKILKKGISDKMEIDKEILFKNIPPTIYFGEESHTIFFTQCDSKKEELLKKVDSTSVGELDQEIKPRLHEVYTSFIENEKPLINHLDSILSQIDAFRAYCHFEKKSPLYEDSKTLASKIELLDRLYKIAKNQELSLQARIDEIKKQARAPLFKNILLTQTNSKSDGTMLKRLFYNLIYSIFKYFGMTQHPEYEYKSLDKVIKTKPLDQSSKNGSGFFAKPSTSKEPIQSLPKVQNKPKRL